MNARRKIKCSFFAAIFLLFFASSASAAVFFVSRPAGDLRVGDEAVFSVRMDAEGESVNSFGGEARFPGFLEPVAARDGNSIASLWIERPVVESGTVRFAGIVPGGYKGDGLLFTVVARVVRDGSGEISFYGMEAYLDDGSGTRTNASGRAHAVKTSPGSPRSGGLPEDAIPPEPFVPVIGQDPSVFDGRFFVAFATTDKQSGVARYEVAEKRGLRTKNFRSLAWEAAESPHALSDQERTSHVYVKAIDEAGNERVATVSPRPVYGGYAAWSILIALLALGYLYKNREYICARTV